MSQGFASLFDFTGLFVGQAQAPVVQSVQTPPPLLFDFNQINPLGANVQVFPDYVYSAGPRPVPETFREFPASPATTVTVFASAGNPVALGLPPEDFFGPTQPLDPGDQGSQVALQTVLLTANPNSSAVVFGSAGDSQNVPRPPANFPDQDFDQDGGGVIVGVQTVSVVANSSNTAIVEGDNL